MDNLHDGAFASAMSFSAKSFVVEMAQDGYTLTVTTYAGVNDATTMNHNAAVAWAKT
jgi:hypothetical protein